MNHSQNILRTENETNILESLLISQLHLGFVIPMFMVQSPLHHENDVLNSTNQSHLNEELTRSQLTALYSMTTGRVHWTQTSWTSMFLFLNPNDRNICIRFDSFDFVLSRRSSDTTNQSRKKKKYPHCPTKESHSRRVNFRKSWRLGVKNFRQKS